MSIEGKAKEAVGFIQEEAFEHSCSPKGREKAQEGQSLRNEGRLEDRKPAKTTEPGAREGINVRRGRRPVVYAPALSFSEIRAAARASVMAKRRMILISALVQRWHMRGKFP